VVTDWRLWRVPLLPVGSPRGLECGGVLLALEGRPTLAVTPALTEPYNEDLRQPSSKQGGPVTDVCDAAWLAELLEHGLLQVSFVPPAPIRELRDLTRYRKRLIQAHVSEGQHI
jgi:hypothetical protein